MLHRHRQSMDEVSGHPVAQFFEECLGAWDKHFGCLHCHHWEEVSGGGRVGWSKSVLAGLNNNTQKLNITMI